MNENESTLQEEATTDQPSNGAAPSNGHVVEGEYGGKNVQVFRDREHIRQRPGMYIGDTSVKGMHHLAYELIYNSVDEALAGHCQNIQVRINADGSLSVIDDGRGIPVDEHPKEKKPTLEVVLTTVGAGAKFDHNTYKVSAGLHGVGAKAVTALAEWAEAEVRRDGKIYVQKYERGLAITEVKEKGTSSRTGTRITFKPDPEIFGATEFQFSTLEERLRELAFLNKGLRFVLHDERTKEEQSYYYEGGIAEYVEYLNRSDDALHPVIYIDETRDDVRVEVAFQYTMSLDQRTFCYANNAFNSAGGTHQSGFRSALTRALKQYGTQENLFKNLEPRGEDFREGMTAIVSVQVPDPQLEAQTKVRLNNPEVDGIVAGVVGDRLKVWLEENPKEAKKIIQKVSLAAEAREAMAKANKALRDRKSILSGGGLPGKLMDCTSPNRDETELFLVEGQSAGGSAESGRDRHYQAVLPMRGKVINVEKARTEKMLGNEEICNLISAVGVDIGNSEELEKLRYNKIVILTDADVDGQHIRTLLLTFFYRQMSKLVENGHIYVARPPLYKITQKKNVSYLSDDPAMEKILMERGVKDAKLSVFPVSEERNGDSEPTATFEGKQLEELLLLLSSLEKNLQVLERRGLDLNIFLRKYDEERGLPLYRILFSGQEEWFYTEEDMEAFRKEKEQSLGQEVIAESDEGDTEASESAVQCIVSELHEVRKHVNPTLTRLRELGLESTDLIPQVQVAGRAAPIRLVLNQGEQRRVIPHLRTLLPEIRRLGERGITVTRFKGLGEMDADELWETTLDPEQRQLFQVRLEDVIKADEMFRTLMGEKVDPRREFINEHALLAEIDYHGA